MFKYFHQIWQSPVLKRKILYTLFILFVFRIAAHITVPGVNAQALTNLFAQNELLGVFSALTGGSMENFSIVLMGLSPYINASIILQLLTVVVPKLEALSKEGVEGRKKINQYTRWLTVPLAFLQSYGMILLLNGGAANGGGMALIENASSPLVILPIMLIVTAGTVLVMWLGELITEKGIGNGISLLIFSSIVSGIPTIFARMFGVAQQDTRQFSYFIAFLILTLIMLVVVVLVTEAQRNIPVTYASRAGGGKGEKANLPIRVNQAGMIPIIFAIAMMTFPSVMAQFFSASTSDVLKNIATFITRYLNPVDNPSYLYIALYFLLIILFSYFYVSVTFNPDQIAENIQKRGGFIPGIRPGKQTAEFLSKVSNHLNLFGGLFLALVAIVPILFTKYTPLQSSDLIITGSGLIIVVGVVLEIIRQIDAQLVMHDYDKLY